MAANVVLEPAPGDQKRVAKRHENIFVGTVMVVIAVDDNLISRDQQIDPHGVGPSVTMMPMRLRDHDVTARDSAGKPLQLVDVIESRLTDRLIDRQVIERNLWLRLHGGVVSGERCVQPHAARSGKR